MDGALLFSGSVGARITTDLIGRPTHVIGIDTEPHTVQLQFPTQPAAVRITVRSNEVWRVRLDAGKAVASRVRSAPFVAPHSSPPKVCDEN